MSRNTQQYSRTGTELQAVPLTSENDPLAEGDTLKIVACPVCRAVYVPSREQQDCSSALLLETAFLEVCHFCFRCQRPACPQCWNPVHHSCASCCEEARLPFRGPVPALEGLVFLPLSSHSAQSNAISFVCQRNGRFYTPEPVLPDAASQKTSTSSAPVSASVAATSQAATSGALPVLPPAQSAPAQALTGTYPVWLQEVLGQKTGETSMPAPAGTEQPADPMSASVSSASAPISWTQTNWPPQAAPAGAQSGVLPAPAQPVTRVESPLPASSSASEPAPIPESQREVIDSLEQEGGEEISLFERIENILIVLTSILLLAVVLMIVLSICFAQVNTFFLALIHIDIRTEIAYLLQMK